MVNNLIDDGRTPFSGFGSESLTLPATWVPATGVGSLTELNSSLQNITIANDRKKIGGGITVLLSDSWQISGNFHHEERRGTDSFGAIFGTTGGNPRGSIVAMPQDFDTEEFDAGVAYKGDKGQFAMTYTLSVFNNNTTSLVFDNPFDNNQWAAASQGSAGARGQISNVSPNNYAWSVNFSGGYNLWRKTRLTGNFSYGEMNQDQTYLPYTVIPDLQATITNPLPRANLDGQIENIYANINLTHRFNNKLDAKLRFTYDDRDNGTPRDTYVRIAGDAQAQPAFDPASGILTGNARVNRPYSLERSKFEIDGGYRLWPMTKLTAGFSYEEIERDMQEVSKTEEQTFHVKLNTAPTDWMSGWAKISYATRYGRDNVVPQYMQDVIEAAATLGPLDPDTVNLATYFNNQPFLEGHAPEYIAAGVDAFLAAPTTVGLAGFFENDPYIRKFYMADRDRTQATANVNFYPNDAVAFSVIGDYSFDDYDESPTGLQDVTRSSLTFDTVYNASDTFNANAYITVEKNDYEQRGFQYAGFDFLNPTNVDRNADIGFNFWRQFSEDSVYTAGAGFEWEVIEDKFSLSLDMTYSDATTEILPVAEIDGIPTNLPPDTPFPDVEAEIYSLMLNGDYQIREGWDVRIYYWYERYRSSDFALDNTDVDTLANGGTGGNVILLGNLSPQYDAHVFGLALRHKF